jgi:hypothetical protein
MSKMPDAECDECARLRKVHDQAIRNIALCEELLQGPHANVADYKLAVKSAEAAEREHFEARVDIEAHRAETGHRRSAVCNVAGRRVHCCSIMSECLTSIATNARA